MSSGPPPPPPTVVNPTLGKDREKLPGWNDPPEMSGASVSSTGNRNRLNKRVGFPTGGAPTQAAGSLSQSNAAMPSSFVMPLSTPPLLQANLPPPPPSNMPDVTSTGSSDVIASNPEGCAKVNQSEVPDLEVLIGKLNTVMDFVGSGPDVRKRVALMQSKWSVLDEKVKVGVGQMVECLVAGDHEGADRYQRGLAVTHSSHCSGWIVAFKRIIADSKVKNSQTTKEEEVQQNTGYMMPAGN